MKFVHTHFGKIALFAAFVVVCAGCNLAPHYKRPAVETPATFKESIDTNIWKTAQPGDALIRSNWWETFNDTNLNALESQIAISNQNVIAAFQGYIVAHEQVREAQAQYFPTLSANPGVTRQRAYTGGGISLRNPNITTYDVPLDGSWQPDFWDRVRNTVRASAAQAQASAADLENTRLAAQAELASDYFQLRGQDQLMQVFNDTITADSNSVQLTTVLFHTGIDSEEDVAQAETVLQTAEAQGTNLGILRAQLEHAIAVLIGRPPESFSLPPLPEMIHPPEIPNGIPSQLLERRPDIAAAERAVMAANAEIGVARAALFPNITLSAAGGFENPTVDSLFSWSSRVWSIGASASQPIFNAALPAAISQYNAAYNASVAQYRQAVLTAFQQVDDNLSALRILKTQIQQQDAAVKASSKYVNLALYRYKLGIDSYLNVITAQTLYLDNRQTLVNLYTQQMTDTVTLIEDLGGGWDAKQLPKN